MKSSIYVVTYQNDLPWFKWCLASIARFWTDQSPIHINVDPGLASTVLDIAHEVAQDRDVIIEPFVQWGNHKAYMFQQWAKMTADQRSDAEWIVFMDSDLIINRSIGLSDFMDQDKDKVRWFYEPYTSVTHSEPGAHKWLSATWRAFNIRPEYEFMRRHPFIIHRETLAGCREYLERQHGPLADYLLNLPGRDSDVEFSEFNCLGFYAWLFNPDKYWFIDVTTAQDAGAKYWTPGTALGVNPVDQHHSWTGDPEQAHGRFLQACEAADFHLKNAEIAHSQIALTEEAEKADTILEKILPVPDNPFEQDLAKIGFVKKEDGETYEKLPVDTVPSGQPD